MEGVLLPGAWMEGMGLCGKLDSTMEGTHRTFRKKPVPEETEVKTNAAPFIREVTDAQMSAAGGRAQASSVRKTLSS